MNDPFGYQIPYSEDWTPQTHSNGRAEGYSTAALVLGICSVAVTCCCCCLFPLTLTAGILAIVFAFLAKRDNNGQMSGKATAGMILGIVGLIFCILLCVVLFGNMGQMPALPDENASNEEMAEWFREYEKILHDAGVDVDLSEYYE